MGVVFFKMFKAYWASACIHMGFLEKKFPYLGSQEVRRIWHFLLPLSWISSNVDGWLAFAETSAIMLISKCSIWMHLIIVGSITPPIKIHLVDILTFELWKTCKEMINCDSAFTPSLSHTTLDLAEYWRGINICNLSLLPRSICSSPR